MLVSAAVAVALAGALGWRFGLLPGSGARPPPIRSIAVLPLANLSGDPEQEYFADGMTDALITELARISAFDKVISRTSTMRLKGTDKSMPEIAAQLGVGVVVEGSVQRAGSRVRVMLQLIEVPEDRHLWSGSFDRDMTDVLALQSQLARTVASQIRVTLTPEEETRLAAPRPVDAEAYEAYLKATQFPTFTEVDYLKAIAYYEHSIDKDPSFAPAHSGLGLTLLSFAAHYRAPADVMPRALEEVSRALELDESLAKAHAQFGTIKSWWQWDWSGAETEFRRGLELGPNDTAVLELYAEFMVEMGRFDEAVAMSRRARELDPVSPSLLPWICHYAGRYDEAIAELLETIELYPNNPGAHFVLAWCYAGEGLFDKAREEGERARALHPAPDEDPFWVTCRAYFYTMTGERTKALETLKHLMDLRRRTYVPPWFVAMVYSGLGDKDHAFEWLERGYEARDVLMIKVVANSTMDPLRDDPRFDDLLRRMNLPPGRRFATNAQ